MALIGIDQGYYNRKRQRQYARPTDFHELSDSFVAAATVTSAEVTLDADAVFRCDLALDAGAQGVIYEQGSATTGALIGINASGDLICRFGDGANPPTGDFARAVLTAGFVPTGLVRLGWAYTLTEGAFVWIDGVLLARDNVTGTPTDWADTADGSYMSATPSAMPTEPGISDFGGGQSGITAIGPLHYQARRAEIY